MQAPWVDAAFSRGLHAMPAMDLWHLEGYLLRGTAPRGHLSCWDSTDPSFGKPAAKAGGSVAAWTRGGRVLQPEPEQQALQTALVYGEDSGCTVAIVH